MLSFSKIIEAALQSGNINISDEVRTQLEADEGLRSFMVVSDSCELCPTLRREDGSYDYKFHVFQSEQGNVFDNILSKDENLKGDPSFIGVFDWNDGNLTQEDTFPMVRCGMAFAIVVGTDFEKDKDALNEVFSRAQFFPVILVQ